MANGWGNRVLWICVRARATAPRWWGCRSHAASPTHAGPSRGLPDCRSPRTRPDWGATPRPRPSGASVYPDLSRERDGLAGALLGRAEAQTLRLSVLYAPLDRPRRSGSRISRRRWPCAELRRGKRAVPLRRAAGRDVVAIADALLDALRRAGRLTRTQIRDLFGRHKDAAQNHGGAPDARTGRPGAGGGVAPPAAGPRNLGGRPMNYLTRAAEAARRWRESRERFVASVASVASGRERAGGEHTEGENQPPRVKGMRQKREKRQKRVLSLSLLTLEFATKATEARKGRTARRAGRLWSHSLPPLPVAPAFPLRSCWIA